MFPNAIIIIYKYHFVRIATCALERVRIEEEKKFSDYQLKYFKAVEGFYLNIVTIYTIRSIGC